MFERNIPLLDYDDNIFNFCFLSLCHYSFPVLLVISSVLLCLVSITIIMLSAHIQYIVFCQ